MDFNEFDRMKGWCISVDPASNLCGVSLWHNGVYIASAVLTSNSNRDPFSVRVQTIVRQLNQFLGPILGEAKVETVVCEGVRSRIVQLCLGSLLTSKYIVAHIGAKSSFVESSQWKNWCKKHGAEGDFKTIKGVKALKQVGWDFEKHPIDSDDIADSILIYLTWLSRGG